MEWFRTGYVVRDSLYVFYTLSLVGMFCPSPFFSGNICFGLHSYNRIFAIILKGHFRPTGLGPYLNHSFYTNVLGSGRSWYNETSPLTELVQWVLWWSRSDNNTEPKLETGMTHFFLLPERNVHWYHVVYGNETDFVERWFNHYPLFVIWSFSRFFKNALTVLHVKYDVQMLRSKLAVVTPRASMF